MVHVLESSNILQTDLNRAAQNLKQLNQEHMVWNFVNQGCTARGGRVKRAHPFSCVLWELAMSLLYGTLLHCSWKELLTGSGNRNWIVFKCQGKLRHFEKYTKESETQLRALAGLIEVKWYTEEVILQWRGQDTQGKAQSTVGNDPNLLSCMDESYKFHCLYLWSWEYKIWSCSTMK